MCRCGSISWHDRCPFVRSSAPCFFRALGTDRYAPLGRRPGRGGSHARNSLSRLQCHAGVSYGALMIGVLVGSLGGVLSVTGSRPSICRVSRFLTANRILPLTISSALPRRCSSPTARPGSASAASQRAAPPRSVVAEVGNVRCADVGDGCRHRRSPCVMVRAVVLMEGTQSVTPDRSTGRGEPRAAAPPGASREVLGPLAGSRLRNPVGRVLDRQLARCSERYPHRGEREVDGSRGTLGHQCSKRLSSAHCEPRGCVCTHLMMSWSAFRHAALLALSDFVPRGPCQEFGERRTHQRLIVSLARKSLVPDDV